MNGPDFNQETRELHLIALARACLGSLQVDDNYGMGLTMDGKRPFGNSGSAGLRDTLEQAGIEVGDLDEEGWDDYAIGLWVDLPKFLRTRVELSLKASF